VLAYGVSFFSGILLMSVVFVPAFAELVLGLGKGASGYVVTPLALASAVGAPLGGMLVDRRGARSTIALALVAFAAGALLLVTWVDSLVTLIIALLVAGFGLGIVLGAPLNHLVLDQVDPARTGSAVSVLSLHRSIGTTLGPSIMAVFMASASRDLPAAMGGALGGVMQSYLSQHPDMAGPLMNLREQMEASSAASAGSSLDTSWLDQLAAVLPADLYGQLDTAVRQVLKTTMEPAFEHMFLVGFIASLLALVLALFLRRGSERPAGTVPAAGHEGTPSTED